MKPGILAASRTSTKDRIRNKVVELFSNGENGRFSDVSVIGSLWQDSDRTIPVTQYGDLVGCIDDLSGNNNHWTQSNPLLRGVYGRVPKSGVTNLCTYSEDLTQALWSSSPNFSVGFDGEWSALTPSDDSARGAWYITESGPLTKSARLTFNRRDSTARSVRVFFRHTVGSGTLFANSTVNLDAGTATNLWVVEYIDDDIITVKVEGVDISETGEGRALCIRLDEAQDLTLYVKGVQVQHTSTLDPFQRTNGVHDITEPGSPDCYYVDFSGGQTYVASDLALESSSVTWGVSSQNAIDSNDQTVLGFGGGFSTNTSPALQATVRLGGDSSLSVEAIEYLTTLSSVSTSKYLTSWFNRDWSINESVGSGTLDTQNYFLGSSNGINYFKGRVFCDICINRSLLSDEENLVLNWLNYSRPLVVDPNIDRDAAKVMGSMDPPLSSFLSSELDSRIREFKSGPINGTNTWDSVDFLFPIMFSREEDAENSLINWKNPSHRAVVHNSPIFTPGPEGRWQGDGVDAWIEWHQESNSSWGHFGGLIVVPGAVPITAATSSLNCGLNNRYGGITSTQTVQRVHNPEDYVVLSREAASFRVLSVNGGFYGSSSAGSGFDSSTSLRSFNSGGTGFHDTAVAFVHHGPELPLTPEQVADLNEIRKRWQWSVAAAPVVEMFDTPPSQSVVMAIGRFITNLHNGLIHGTDTFTPASVIGVHRIHDEQASLINWRDPSGDQFEVENNPTFTPFQNWQGDGVDARILLPISPSLHSGSLFWVGEFVSGRRSSSAVAVLRPNLGSLAPRFAVARSTDLSTYSVRASRPGWDETQVPVESGALVGVVSEGDPGQPASRRDFYGPSGKYPMDLVNIDTSSTSRVSLFSYNNDTSSEGTNEFIYVSSSGLTDNQVDDLRAAWDQYVQDTQT